MGRIADGQHGVISRQQLRAIGIGDAAIDHAATSGRLYPIFRATFGVGHRQVGRPGLLRAGVLACGEGSVLSHGTAAALQGLWEYRPLLIDVVAPAQAGRKIDGIYRRHVPLPLPDEVWTPDGIPSTNPSRTIVDVAGIVREASLRRTIEQAAVRGVLNVAEIESILTGPRRCGSPRLRMVLDDWRRYPADIRLRSLMEAKLLPLLSQRAIPIPECNRKLRIGAESFEIDFLWRGQRLAVEDDGGKYHDNPLARVRDSHRDRVLADAGYLVPRLSWEDLRDRPEATVAEIDRLLRLRSATVP